MGWITGIAVYAIIWWLVIFMVLPWGNRRPESHELEPGQDPGAPVKPRIFIKFAATTVISGVIFGIVYWVMEARLISLGV